MPFAAPPVAPFPDPPPAAAPFPPIPPRTVVTELALVAAFFALIRKSPSASPPPPPLPFVVPLFPPGPPLPPRILPIVFVDNRLLPVDVATSIATAVPASPPDRQWWSWHCHRPRP